MKRSWMLALLLALVSGCASQPPFVDNGKPGQLKIVVFYDDNKNGVMDASETGTATQVAVSQEVSCPPTGKPAWTPTDATGVYTYPDLKPGKYCVFTQTNTTFTTKLTQEVYVSSELITTVAFGMLRPQP